MRSVNYELDMNVTTFLVDLTQPVKPPKKRALKGCLRKSLLISLSKFHIAPMGKDRNSAVRELSKRRRNIPHMQTKTGKHTGKFLSYYRSITVILPAK